MMKQNSDFSKSNNLLKKLPTKKKILNDKKELLAYLANEYGITYFNKSFGYKIDHIHNGTLQNLQMPISYDVLLDMFKYYKQFLTKQKIYNKKVGKEFTGQQGILNYDLAIVLSKHSDYIQVLEQENINRVETSKIASTAKLIENVAIHNNESIEQKDLDIENMLEDW